MTPAGKPDIEWPERLTLRDTKIHADEGQRIYTTATGYGYEKREYVRADLLAEARAQIAAKDAALALFDAYYELPDRTREELEVKLAAWAAWLATRDALSQSAPAQEDKP